MCAPKKRYTKADYVQHAEALKAEHPYWFS
jgi:hypothetical protein